MKTPFRERSLADVVEVASGQVDPREEPYSSMPHIGGDNIESHTGRISGTQTASKLGLKSGKYLFDPSYVLYSKIRPNLNKVADPDFAGICSADIYPIRPLNGEIDKRFLVYVLRSNHFLAYAAKHSSRTNIPKINRPTLLAYRFPLPPLPEQKRIADILDKADAIRRKRQEAGELIQDVPLAAFRETFAEFLDSKRTETVLSDTAEVVSGVAKGRKLNGEDIREVPYLRVANVQAGFLDLTEIKTIPAKQSEIDALALQHGDVVLTEGGDHDKLGRGALWEHDVPNCIHQNHVFRVRVDRKRLIPTFFVHLLQTEIAKAYFLRCAKKTTNLASINMTQLRSLPVPLPPLKLQERFDQEFRTVTNVIDRQSRAEREADDLFNSLVQRAFKGEL